MKCENRFWAPEGAKFGLWAKVRVQYAADDSSKNNFSIVNLNKYK